LLSSGWVHLRTLKFLIIAFATYFVCAVYKLKIDWKRAEELKRYADDIEMDD
jgi:hypothetical protein